MSISPRPYEGLHDLERMKSVIIEGRKISPHSAYPHIGDLDWWLFYGAPIRQYLLSDIAWLWQDDVGKTGAWVYFTPHSCEFETALLPEWRGGDYEAQITAWATERLTEQARATQKPVGAFASADDTARCAILETQGYTYANDFLAYFTQPLDVPLPEPRLPDGFSFLDMMHEDLADQRADVHFNSFHPSRMTGDAYRNFMQAPGYDPTLDIVVVAPDGEFAAFAMGWLDPVNKISIFEPVGTRDTMQRRGLGKATLLEGLRRLQARGMKIAMVCTHATNANNVAFYQSAGFQRVNTIRTYNKQMSGI